jgi:DNA primase large subunit
MLAPDSSGLAWLQEIDQLFQKKDGKVSEGPTEVEACMALLSHCRCCRCCCKRDIVEEQETIPLMV